MSARIEAIPGFDTFVFFDPAPFPFHLVRGRASPALIRTDVRRLQTDGGREMPCASCGSPALHRGGAVWQSCGCLIRRP